MFCSSRAPQVRKFTLCAAVAAFAAVLVLGTLAGCSSAPASNEPSGNQPSQEKQLEGAQLNIYCGAGMTDPFQKIAAAFEEETGCKMNVTFANAAQIQTQINTTEEGDFFIAGSAEELKPIEPYVESSVDLVKHIPVLVVPEGNPANIQSLADLGNASRVLVGDPEATPIGKIAKNALTKAGVWDAMMSAGIVTTTTTAPQIATALANGEGDAGIVWKENVKAEGTEILEGAGMENFIKTIPAAQLTCAANADAVAAFSEFLAGDTAQGIWVEFGYELV